MVCPHESGCSLFSQRALQPSLRIWRSYYCDCDFERCERYRLAAAGTDVPINLLPNGRLLELPLRNLGAVPTTP
jgi:hypothetical protein